MSRAARRPKTRQELERMSVGELNAQISYLKMRLTVVSGRGPVAKAFRKEIAAVEREKNARR